jgi:hypothetical protein
VPLQRISRYSARDVSTLRHQGKSDETPLGKQARVSFDCKHFILEFMANTAWPYGLTLTIVLQVKTFLRSKQSSARSLTRHKSKKIFQFLSQPGLIYQSLGTSVSIPSFGSRYPGFQE